METRGSRILLRSSIGLNWMRLKDLDYLSKERRPIRFTSTTSLGMLTIPE